MLFVAYRIGLGILLLVLLQTGVLQPSEGAPETTDAPLVAAR